MPDKDTIVSQWAQELLHGALVVDAPAAAQVWDATLDLRKSATTDVDKWFADSFMNAPPLSHNTLAFNQVQAAITDLKNRLSAVDQPPAPPAPAPKPVAPAPAAADKE